MEKYNYKEVVKADIRQWMEENKEDYEDVPESQLYDHLCDAMYDDDDVTGSTSYYDSEYNCEEYLCHNYDLLFEALCEFGELEASLIDTIRRVTEVNAFARWADTTIRCYLLSPCLWEVLNELGYTEI
jgi:hypothetical protein